MNTARLLSLIALSVLAIGCAKKSSSPAPAAGQSAPVITPPPPGTPWTPPTTGPGQNPGTPFVWGGTADFVFDSADAYRQYTQRFINNLSELSNVKINLNFNKYGTSYGGTVTIRYFHQGFEYEGFFTSGWDSSSTRYNIWFPVGANKVWHGFFEDFMGSIIVVLDGTASLNDGIGLDDTVSGSIWFKNWAPSPEPHPPTYCWFVVGGAYDCRAWKTGRGVNTRMAANPLPTDGYTRLGTFTGVPVMKAFNNEIVIQ